MNKIKVNRIYFLVICLAIISCSNSLVISSRPTDKMDLNKIDVDGTLGVISLNPKIEYTKYDTIKLLNKNGTLWHSFNFYYDDSDGNYEFYNTEFNPFMFHPDYFLLGLIVESKISYNYYKVEVNMEKNIKKYLYLKDYMILRPWKDFVVSVNSISFDQNNNPLRANNKISSKKIEVPNNVEFRPVMIKDEWLQVEWGRDDSKSVGWVKWKDKGFLNVTLNQIT